MTQQKLSEVFAYWADNYKNDNIEKVYKVFLLDKNNNPKMIECFTTKCTKEEIKELVGILNSFKEEEQTYLYYLVHTDGE